MSMETPETRRARVLYPSLMAGYRLVVDGQTIRVVHEGCAKRVVSIRSSSSMALLYELVTDHKCEDEVGLHDWRKSNEPNKFVMQLCDLCGEEIDHVNHTGIEKKRMGWST